MINGIDEKHEKLHTLNRRISIILRIGIALSLLLMAAGLVLFITGGAPHMAGLTPAASLIHDLFAATPSALVTLGLFIGLLMPVAVLITAFVHFIVTRETRPLVVCAVLIIMLAASYILVLK